MNMKLFQILVLVISLPLFAGCATTPRTTTDTSDNIDPFEPVNRKVYSFNDGMDRYFLKPVATVYADITPDLMQTGVTNFFNNITYLNVILNSSLQGKVDQGFSDLFRFVFNSTLGVAGLFDVATPMGIPAHKEDLGQTFAVWGLGQGPYLTLPFFGPNTARDTPDIVTSWLLDPLRYMAAAISLPATALEIINLRANLLEATNALDEAALDPYSFTREAYLQRRNFLIHDGAPPTSAEEEDIFSEPLEN